MTARIVHYINQFFAGIGGEERANQPIDVREGPVGPGRALQVALGDRGRVVATIVGGDNYVIEEREVALAAVRRAIEEHKPDVVVAGPAFDAGRYGVACGLVCQVVRSLGIPTVTAMYPENPAVALYRTETVIVPTGANAASMAQAIPTLARLALKLAGGEELASAEADGFLGRGIRVPGHRAETGHARVAAMLRAKLRGEPFVSELPILAYEAVPPAPPISDLRNATVALITTGGLVPRGNPDRLSAASATEWFRYRIEGLDALSAEDWDCVHRGFYTEIVKQNPNYILPLHVLRQLERERVIGGIYPWCFSTSGVGTANRESKRMGVEMAAELRAARVDVALLVAT